MKNQENIPYAKNVITKAVPVSTNEINVNVAIPIVTAYINPRQRSCRRCGKSFIPTDISNTNANSFRCQNCMNNLIVDFLYSCTVKAPNIRNDTFRELL